MVTNVFLNWHHNWLPSDAGLILPVITYFIPHYFQSFSNHLSRFEQICKKVISTHYAIRVINSDEFLFLFFFFVMVVANCNASCYWLLAHCSQWQLLLFFPSGIKIAFVAIWRVSCGELGFCLTRCTNPELVAKCEHILCMTSNELNERAAKPKFVAQS